MIKKIIFEVGEKEIELTLEEFQKLKEDFKTLEETPSYTVGETQYIPGTIPGYSDIKFDPGYASSSIDPGFLRPYPSKPVYKDADGNEVTNPEPGKL